MASINLQSKDSGGDDGSRSPARSRGVSSPWSKIVRGGSDEFPPPVVSVAAPAPPPPSVQEQIVNPSSDWYPPKAVPETASSPDDSGTECQPEGSDNGGGGSNAFKKPVWSKPSNGDVEVVSPVMGAVSWPALGESTKASPKSSSSESLQALSDGSLLPALQVTGNSSPSSHKLASANNVNPTSTPNHVPSGQRSVKQSGGSLGAYVPANEGVSQQPTAIQDLKVEALHKTSGKTGTVAMESYHWDHTHKESQRGGSGSQSNSGNDHRHPRNSYRRGNGGQHPRGDGSYHHNYGGKLDQSRGNQEWNQHRSFNNRNANMQPPRGFRRGYVRPSVHTSTPFIPPMPVPVRPFGNNVMYPDVASAMPMIYVQGPPPPDSLRSMPLVSPIPGPMYFTVPDPLLHAKIVNQIDYYFSNENLVKDTYLRRNMDEQGWVPVNLIAGFKKVSCLTDNVQIILNAMRTSTVVEVQGDKIRRRNDWMRWLMPPPAQYLNVSIPEAIPSSLNQDALASQLQGIALDGATSENQVHVETFSSRSSSGEFSSQLQQAGDDGSVRISNQQAGFERATAA